MRKKAPEQNFFIDNTGNFVWEKGTCLTGPTLVSANGTDFYYFPESKDVGLKMVKINSDGSIES